MSEVIVIGTHHSERGECNAGELLKIINSIAPDVIFEELSPSLSKIIYSSSFPDEPLEVKAIKGYLADNPIPIVPVDIEVDHSLTTQQIKWMFETFKKFQAYRELEVAQAAGAFKRGFAFLNSQECDDLFREKSFQEKSLLEFMSNKNQLANIYRLFTEEQNKREATWLENIIDYGSRHTFAKAIFTVGVGHRNGLKEKMVAKAAMGNQLLIWTIYNG